MSPVARPLALPLIPVVLGDSRQTFRVPVRTAAKFGFKGKAWAGASEPAKHFVRSLLLKSPDLRLTAEGAQKHNWLRGAEDLSQAPQKCAYFRADVTQSLLDFR